LAQALNETRAGINVDSNWKILYENENEEADSDDSDVSDGPGPTDGSKATEKLTPMFGSGLKRPLDGVDGSQPVMKKRRRLRKLNVAQPEGELPWEGFSSAEESNTSPPSLTSSTGTQTDSDNDEGKVELSDEDSSPEESTSGDEDDPNAREDRKERSSAFKAWASYQVSEALGFTPTSGIQQNEGDVTLKPRPPEQDPLPPELEVRGSLPYRKAFSVVVHRSTEIQEARLALPVVAEEQKIMEAIYNNPVVVIWGMYVFEYLTLSYNPQGGPLSTLCTRKMSSCPFVVRNKQR